MKKMDFYRMGLFINQLFNHKNNRETGKKKISQQGLTKKLIFSKQTKVTSTSENILNLSDGFVVNLV